MKYSSQNMECLRRYCVKLTGEIKLNKDNEAERGVIGHIIHWEHTSISKLVITLICESNDIFRWRYNTLEGWGPTALSDIMGAHLIEINDYKAWDFMGKP